MQHHISYCQYGDTWLALPVERLHEVAKRYPVESVEPRGVLRTAFWFRHEPSALEVIEEIERALRTDMTYPVVLSPSYVLLDGAHRAARAVLQGLPLLGVRIRDWGPLLEVALRDSSRE